jgi:hypothetical protein
MCKQPVGVDDGLPDFLVQLSQLACDRNYFIIMIFYIH